MYSHCMYMYILLGISMRKRVEIGRKGREGISRDVKAKAMPVDSD